MLLWMDGWIETHLWSDKSCLAVWWSSLGLADAENITGLNANCKVWWRRDSGMGLLVKGWAKLLTSIEGKS